MNKNELDWLTYIGRFSPCHHGHFSVIRHGLMKAKKLIVCIGSSNSPRTIKNPWTADERANMIRAGLTEDENKRVFFQYIEDRLYQNDEWASLIRAGTRSVLMEYHAGKPELAKMGLLLAEKDDTSWYKNMFPEWKKEFVDVSRGVDGDNPFGATKIRELMFTGHVSYIQHAVPEGVYNLIKEFTHTSEFVALKAEYQAGIDYERLYENHPKGHSINFYTADSVIYQSGHVLLVKRKFSPGKDLWAVPGGHVDPNETSEDASIREIMEETAINVTESTLKLARKGYKLFEHPDRSMRARITKKNARTVTVSYFYKLNDGHDLPRVKGGDDAEQAWWFPIETIKNMRNELFEDHLDQILYWIARIEK